MRVLHVLPFVSIRTGGMSLFATEAAAALAGLGVESTVVATDVGEAPTVRRPRPINEDEYPPNLDKFELKLFPARSPYGVLYSPELARFLKQSSGFDLIHVHSLWMHMHWAAGRLAQRSGTPLVISPQGTLDPLLLAHRRLPKLVMRKLWQDRMIERAQMIHLASQNELDQMTPIAPDVPRTIIPLGIDTADLAGGGDGSAFRARFGLENDQPLVMFLGRITFKKRLDVLVSAFAKTAERFPAARLAIVGPDDEDLEEGLRAQASSLGIGDKVLFTGPLYRSDRDDALAAADVWALTSDVENFGIAVIEAMAAGCAVVASHGVNIADEIAAEGGLIATSLDPNETADAFVSLLDDPERRRRLAARGREVAAGYDWSVVAPRLRELYRTVIAG